MVKVVYDFYMTQAARALEIACDSRKRKSYRLNRPIGTLRQTYLMQTPKVTYLPKKDRYLSRMHGHLYETDTSLGGTPL